MQEQSPRRYQAEIGAFIRSRRKDLGLSQAELARRTDMGLDASAISRIESGERSLQLFEASVIARELGVTLQSFADNQTVDPAQRVVDEAVAAAKADAEAELVYIVSVDKSMMARERLAQALDALSAVIDDIGGMSVSSQVTIVRKMRQLLDGRQSRQELYDKALARLTPEARGVLDSDGATDD